MVRPPRATAGRRRRERTLRAQGIPVERLGVAEAARLFPSFRGDDLEFVLLEPEAGVLRAQRARPRARRAGAAHGARIVRRPRGPTATRSPSTARALEADAVVWACGAWLAELFPDHVILDDHPAGPVLPRRRPGLDARPGWVDYDGAVYGTGDLDGHGFKVAPDSEGPPLDPDAPLPPADPANEALGREYLAQRFPALAGAPRWAPRACRYELSPDSHFVAAPHPEHPRVWLLGGGSGHGFKHGPAIAEHGGCAGRR